MQAREMPGAQLSCELTHCHENSVGKPPHGPTTFHRALPQNVGITGTTIQGEIREGTQPNHVNMQSTQYSCWLLQP